MRYFSFKCFAFGGKFTSAYIVKCGLVWSNHATTCAHFNTHVANRHAAFHTHFLKNITCKLYEVARACVGSQFGDDIEHHVFGFNSWVQFARNNNTHAFGFVNQYALTGKYLRDLTGSYAKSNGTKCTMRRGVTVATNHGHARLGNPKFWTNNVHNSLIGMPQSKEVNAMRFAVFGKLAYLLARQGILDG